MKKQLPNGFAPLSELELVILTAEVKETLAKDYSLIRQRILNAEDLWNKRQNPGRWFFR